MSTNDTAGSVPYPHDEDQPDPHLHDIDYSEDTNVGKIHESIMREKNEPREGMEPVPLWLMCVIMLTMFAGGVYLGMFSGGFRADVYNERAGLGPGPSEEKGKGGPNQTGGGAAAAPVDPVAELTKLGKRQYSNNCAACHQPTGMGVTGVNPPLAKSEIVTGPERRPISIVLFGMEGSVTVQGCAYNGAMPAWGKNMKDKEIAAVLTYIRQEWGNSASPISPEQVAAVRKDNEGRSKCFTEAEVKALPETPVPGGFTAPASGGDKKP